MSLLIVRMLWLKVRASPLREQASSRSTRTANVAWAERVLEEMPTPGLV